MSGPWSSNEGSSDGSSDTDAEHMRTAIHTEAIDQLPLRSVEEGVDGVEDKELLKRGFEKSSKEEVEEVFRKRLHELDSVPPNGETKQSRLNESQVNMSQESESSVEESSIDIDNLAPNAMGANEAREKDHRWKILVWGQPGSGKTHFVYTAEDPLCIIDTEGKSDDIAHKFPDKDFYIWQPSGYDEALEAVHEALDVLDHYKSENGRIGTICVDSMSILWEWSQQKYVDKFYPSTPFEDAKEQFSSGFGGGQSDWKQIKSYHSDFRQVMTESEYNMVWTAMEEQDYSAKMEDGVDRKKPVGEKNNVYKVDHILHIDQDHKGVPTGSLEKSGLTKYRFTGLEYPTFEKTTEVVNAIEEAELSDEEVEVSELTDHDISVMQGNPRFVDDE